MKISQILLAASVIALASGCTSARQQFGSARAVNLDQLPAPAQATVRNEVGDLHIKRITEETKYGRPTYRVEIMQPWFNSTLWVNPNGAIVNESDRLVSQRNYKINEASGAQPERQNEPPGTK
jgi:hypothetical protein